MAGVCVLEARHAGGGGREGSMGVGVAWIFRIPGEEGIFFFCEKRSGFIL